MRILFFLSFRSRGGRGPGPRNGSAWQRLRDPRPGGSGAWPVGAVLGLAVPVARGPCGAGLRAVEARANEGVNPSRVASAGLRCAARWERAAGGNEPAGVMFRPGRHARCPRGPEAASDWPGVLPERSPLSDAPAARCRLDSATPPARSEPSCAWPPQPRQQGTPLACSGRAAGVRNDGTGRSGAAAGRYAGGQPGDPDGRLRRRRCHGDCAGLSTTRMVPTTVTLSLGGKARPGGPGGRRLYRGAAVAGHHDPGRRQRGLGDARA